MSVTLVVGFVGVLSLGVYFFYQKYKESKKFWDVIDKIPGPPAIFLFGNTHQFKLDQLGKT